MAKVSVKSPSFKSFKPVKVSKAPSVSKPKTITAQKPATVGKPVVNNTTTVKTVTDKPATVTKTVATPKVAEKQIITKEVSKPQYIYSGGSSGGFGDMLSNYIMLDWMFGSRNNSSAPVPAAQTAPAAQPPASTSTTASSVQPNDSSIVDGSNSINAFFPLLTCLSIVLIATLIPFAVYKYLKKKQEADKEKKKAESTITFVEE